MPGIGHGCGHNILGATSTGAGIVLRKLMDEIGGKVYVLGSPAALGTGTELEISTYEAIYKGLVTNETLSKLYENNLKDTGVKKILAGETNYGSTDMGDVSQVCPTISTSFAIVADDESLIGHTVEFAQATLTEVAYKGMEDSMYALISTGVDIIKDEDLLKKVKEEFNLTFKKQ